MNIEYKNIKDYLRYIPDFNKEILQTWIKMGGGQTKTLSHFAEIRKQPSDSNRGHEWSSDSNRGHEWSSDAVP
jgi:hypothetical protein